MKLARVNVAEKFALFDDTWSPKIVGELNGFYVKIVRMDGAFVWHQHDLEDELFFVVEGTLEMRYRDEDGSERTEDVDSGEFVVVPRGVVHCPVAAQPVKLILIEPKTTTNTGTERNERTRDPVWL
jgi:mannose-6-phosphate isomerase-like protein (cupin superfamily)